MTLKELKSKVSVKSVLSPGYLVTISYRGKNYSCISNNSLAYYRVVCSRYVPDRLERHFYTLKAAYLSFYDECKAKNGLKISKN